MNSAGARIVVVLGMHRSGTSLITRALEVLGVSLGDRLMPPADGNNAKGFFEDIDINALNIALMAELGSAWHAIEPIAASGFERLRRDGWVEKALAILRAKTADGRVFGFKDPRTAQLLPFWQEVFRAGGLDVKYLLALRNPASVAGSLVNRDRLPRERSYYLWLEHMLNSLAGALGGTSALVDYDKFFGNADLVLDQIGAALGFEVDLGERERFKDEFVDEALRHTVHVEADLAADPSCPPLVAEFYSGLTGAVRDCVLIDSPELRASIARWYSELDRNRPALRLADSCLAQPAQVLPQAAALEILKALARTAPESLFEIFDSSWYAAAYPDVAAAGLGGYRHYSDTGVFEGRFPTADVVQAAQRALGGLVAGRDKAGELIAVLEQARRDEGRWADMMELQRALVEREARLDETLQRTQRELREALEQRAEREAAWVAREREAAQAVEQAAQRHAAELQGTCSAGALREKALGEQRENAEAEIRRLLIQAADREAAYASACAAIQREQAAELAALTQRASERSEALLRQLADVESKTLQRETALQAAHVAQLALSQRERDEAEAAWRARLAQEAAVGAAAQARAQEAHAAIAAERDSARAELDAARRTVAWRMLAPLLGWRR